MKIIIFVFLFMLLVPLVLASHISDHIDPLLEQQDFLDALNKDPVAAFASDPVQAWEAIRSDPSLMTNPSIANQAFQNNPFDAADLVNNNINLLDSGHILEEFNRAAISSIEILNQNPQAKVKWFQELYFISDKGVKVHSYDGSELTMEGKLEFEDEIILKNTLTTFSPKDFPGAILDPSGAVIKGGSVFFGTESLKISLTELDEETIFMQNGDAEISVGEKLNMDVKGGRVLIKNQEDESIAYSGKSFSLVKNEKGVSVKSEEPFERKYAYAGENDQALRSAIITGEILDPKDSLTSEFIIKGDSQIKFKTETTFYRLINNKEVEKKSSGDTSILEIESGNEVYYTESKFRTADNFCNSDFSCIINNPAEASDPTIRHKFEVQELKNNDKIKFKTASRYDKFEIDEPTFGEVSIISLSKEGRFESEIKVTSSPEDGTKLKTKGVLSKTNAGRVDVFYEESDTLKMHHWSSNEFYKYQGVKNYFTKPRNNFVTCEIGIDCEPKIAKAFGRIYPTGAKNVQTTIIIAGENVRKAHRFRETCLKQGGCYILNSRDVPPTTDSKNIVLNGHHWGKTNYIWRDAPTASEDRHVPIDPFYFDEMPEGPVEAISFKSCNTVNSPNQQDVYEGFNDLKERYPTLNRVQGWEGIAPPTDKKGPALEKSYTNSEIKDLTFEKPDWYGRPGRRAWYIKVRDEWKYTNDGVNCVPINGGDSNSCGFVEVATIDSNSESVN
jgi:hypothetical protein